jgi:hypothetical protein
MTGVRLAVLMAATAGLWPSLFVVFHAGPLGEDACARSGSAGPGSLSLDPLGTLCRAGESGRIESVLVNNYFWLTSGLIVFSVVALGVLWLVMRGPSANP